MVQAWRAFADLLPVLVLALVVAVPVGVWCARRRVLRDGESWREALLVVGIRMSAVAAFLGVLGLTLKPLSAGLPSSTNWVPFATIIDQMTSQVDTSIAFRNVALNVALFVPVGFSWAWTSVLSGRSWRIALVAGVGLSVFVEVTQMLIPLGRALDVDDVILNSAGVVAGAVAAKASGATPERFGEPMHASA